MRKLLSAVVLVISVALGACVANRFESIAIQAAAAQTTCYSPTAVKTTELSSWAFRVDTCNGPSFYRCWYQRHTIGHVQCCARVASEEDATNLVGPSLDGDPSKVCGEAP